VIEMTNTRKEKDRIADEIEAARDRLQILYDWNTEGLEAEDLNALRDLIGTMYRTLARFKQ
jgi:hypothetical protein